MFGTKRKKQLGFGLVEVLVSITLLTLVMLALNFLSRAAYYNWENAQNKTVAYNIIQSTIEDLHNKRDTNVVSAISVAPTWSTGLDSTPANSPQKTTINNRDYLTTITVSPITVSLPGWPGLDKVKIKVVVTITWKERLGDRSLTGVTYLTDWKSKY